MDALVNKRWLLAVILFGVVYLIVGMTFAALAGWSASNQMRTAWRLTAFLTSARRVRGSRRA